MEPTAFKYDITPVWDISRQIRNKVESIFAVENKDLQDASKMVSSELLENAIKYGSSIDPENKIGIRFEIDVDHRCITIKVINRIIDPTDFENFKNHVNKIKSSNNPEQLYIQQLTSLIENPKLGQSQLGLYRIAFEGEFTIDYSFENNILTVVAKRNI